MSSNDLRERACDALLSEAIRVAGSYMSASAALGHGMATVALGLLVLLDVAQAIVAAKKGASHPDVDLKILRVALDVALIITPFAIPESIGLSAYVFYRHVRLANAPEEATRA